MRKRPPTPNPWGTMRVQIAKSRYLHAHGSLKLLSAVLLIPTSPGVLARDRAVAIPWPEGSTARQHHQRDGGRLSLPCFVIFGESAGIIFLFGEQPCRLVQALDFE